MVAFYENTLCIEGGWLYGENKIMTKSNYDAMIRRKKMIRLCVGGNGRRAWIAFDSIPLRFQKKIVELIGNPYSSVKHILLEDYIKPDFEAENYFRTYTLDNGTALPEHTQKEYIDTARILNACHYISTNVIVQKKFGGKSTLWKNFVKAIESLPKHTYKHKLPGNSRDLKAKCLAYKGVKLSKRYSSSGYEGLIHKGFLNTSAQKITNEAGRWLLARWCNQVNKCVNIAQLHCEYNEYATAKGWKHVNSEKTLYNFLYSEDVQHLWYGYRFGELKAKEKFEFKLKTKLPSMRDSLWYGDGTKLNYFYVNEKGKMETCQVYEVMDAYSEVLLGFHISKVEDYEAQYSAFRMAVETAGHLPYQVAYDNQGGHKKLKNSNFLSKVSHIQTATRPYNGKSKTIENAFCRLQSQFLKRDWFFTGMNITTKKEESRANMEFILANLSSLPTLSEVKSIYAQRRREWNQSPHPKTGKPRIEMYLNSTNPETKKIEIWDMVNLFWITRKNAITCDASGISFIEKNIKYSYMVYHSNKKPNLTWLQGSIGKKFVVKFDPMDTSVIYLYENTPLGLRFVTEATLKIETSRGLQDQEEWEAEYMHSIIKSNNLKRIERRDLVETILQEYGMSAEQQGLVRPNLKGIEKKNKGNRKNKNSESSKYGRYIKNVSNQDWIENEDSLSEAKLSEII